MKKEHIHARRKLSRFTARVLSIGLLSFGVASCDFDVVNIASVGEETLEDVAVVPLLLASAEAAVQAGWRSFAATLTDGACMSDTEHEGHLFMLREFDQMRGRLRTVSEIIKEFGDER